MSLRMCDDRLCDECDDLNRAASEGRACADQSSRDAENSSAARPTQATGTLNNNTVNNNGVIIDEMLCFVQNIIDTRPPMSIGDLCTATFTEHDIEASKRRLFELCADDSCCTRMRKRIGPKRSAQNIEDIIRLLQEKGTDTITFVALETTPGHLS